MPAKTLLDQRRQLALFGLAFQQTPLGDHAFLKQGPVAGQLGLDQLEPRQ
ncbi:MAG: hypothetical protein KFB96_16575 [Thiocapsa sp.]|nr:MAG: hypothetical protein KFB96_16575 [Thiocapsa sp.]